MECFVNRYSNVLEHYVQQHEVVGNTGFHGVILKSRRSESVIVRETVKHNI